MTDANLALGRFGGVSLLGGAMPIHLDRARSALSRLASEMSRFADKPVSIERAALGVIRVANANMEAALRVVSVERGQDPRLFTLVSFGGAGGLHVCDLAAALRIPSVVVPSSPGTLSALGVLLGDVVKNYSRTVMIKTSGLDLLEIERSFAELERDAEHDLGREGFGKDRIKLDLSVAMRYAGQSFEIDVPWSKRFDATFHEAHRERYGYADSSRATEIVSLRLRAVGVTQKPRIKRHHSDRPKAVAASRIERAFLDERAVPVPVYDRDALDSGARVKGPAIVTEYSSTTLIPRRCKVEVDPWLNLLIEVA